MQRRTTKGALLTVLAIVMVLGVCTAALADQTWSDLPDSVNAKYGVTDNQIAAISEGYSNGFWRPFSTVSRAPFTKMAVAAFGIPLASPAIASYIDVPKSSYYQKYVEGAKAAGVVTGTTTTTFSPNVKITRQQAIAIIARYIAKAQGFNLATKYSAEQISKLLAHFADATSISVDLRDEVAFAFDMGLTQGDDYGNLKPLGNLTRIQAAALLIRAQAISPPNQWVPGSLALVSTDKTEGLIGQAYNATFKVTTADGHPAAGVLVDFDSQMADFYVGNVEPEAQVTDNKGEVTVTLLSAEPGTQRISASVSGLPLVYTTRYWLALDEVYNTEGNEAQNNAGVEHEWTVRVVVFGPGPRSTSVSDWYNAIDASFDPTDVDVEDGIDYNHYFDEKLNKAVTVDGWVLADEQQLAAHGFKPRTLAGVNVEWSIYNGVDDPKTSQVNEAVTSVGNITKVEGANVTPAKSAVGKTKADGLSTVTVLSEATGVTLTKAVADYLKNPYPEQLFNHLTFQNDTWWHDFNWDDQPSSNALQRKTWIPHTLSGGNDDGPVSPSYMAPNVGEEKTLTLTLLDAFGNPVSGKSVEWYMQGVGFFQTDDSGDRSDPLVAANNVDFDVTNAAGKAKVFVKSYDSGEQIVHAKVRDKGTGGAEGTFATYTAEVQWFDVDIATFDDITTQGVFVDKYTDVNDGVTDNYWTYLNEALSSNALGTSHTFTLSVYGLKLEYDSSVNEPDGQTSFIDSDYAAASYDKIMDWRDAAYFGGILMWSSKPDQVQAFDDKMKLYTYLPGVDPTDKDKDGVIEADNNGSAAGGEDERGTKQVQVGGKWLKLSFEGAYTMYDYDDDGYPEEFAGESTDEGGVSGIYLPLAGKTVTFAKANESGVNLSNLGVYFDQSEVAAVATATPTTPVVAVTDSNGKASITVTNSALGSAVKGPETVRAVVTWEGNPHDGSELATAYAKKSWVAGITASATDVTIKVSIDGVLVASNKLGKVADGRSAAWSINTLGNRVLNSAHVEVHVYDVYGNDLPDYEVVYLLESINGWLGGTQSAYNTYIPGAYLTDIDTSNDFDGLPLFDNLGALYPNYDQNATRPDSDEPMQQYDPYAKVVGAGGTLSFFFNQWLGSEKPTYSGQPGTARATTLVGSQAFTGYTGGNALATDGAKAWTLDGYYAPWLTGFVPSVTISVAATPIQATAVAAMGGSPFIVTSVIVTNGGSGYSTPPTVTFAGGGASVQATGYANISGGMVTSITVPVGSGGTGYTSAPTVSIAAAPAPVAATASATVAGGAVTVVTLLTGGSGYMTAPTVTIQAPPSGTAATAAATVNAAGQVTGLTLLSGGTGYGTSGTALAANKLTGSNIDIQLTDPFTGTAATGSHWKSILRVMVYGPADGLVKEEDYIWSYQVHQAWEEPVPTTITLAVTPSYGVAGSQTQTLTAKVLDQFGNPMPGEQLTVNSERLEGNFSPQFSGSHTSLPTDGSGNTVIGPWGQDPGDWGVESVVAVARAGQATSKTSNAALIQWIYNDNWSPGGLLYMGATSYGPNLIWGTQGASRVTVHPAFGLWVGRSLLVFAAPGGTAISTARTYVSGAPFDLSTTAALGTAIYVNASDSTNTDNQPNWLYDVSLTP